MPPLENTPPTNDQAYVMPQTNTPSPARSNTHRTLLIILVAIGIALVLFLIYQNGKSIYTHGI